LRPRCNRTVDVLQDDDGAQLRRELLHGSGELSHPYGRLGRRLGLGVERRLDRLVDRVERLGATPAPLLHQRGGGVGRDAVHPRRELGVPSELSDALPGSEIRLLHHVSRVLLVGRQPHGERVGVDVGAAHQLVERGPVAAASRVDQPVYLCSHLGGWVRGHSDS
jgi:hypothetical protein